MVTAAGPLAIAGAAATSAALLWMMLGERVSAGLSAARAEVRSGSAGSVPKLWWEGYRRAQRRKRFMPQLEGALRMTAGSLRVGLSLRQAFVAVAEELDDPARTEFMRVVGRTNLGLTMNEALDELVERMPSAELSMTVRAIRVQSQTGGDLAELLLTVADTIKARRTLARKVAALTAEGRISAVVILALPIGVGIFLGISQPRMGHALLATFVGHATLCAVVALEAVASFVIMKMLKVEL
jgi:tight adherence protein B